MDLFEVFFKEINSVTITTSVYGIEFNIDNKKFSYKSNEELPDEELPDDDEIIEYIKLFLNKISSKITELKIFVHSYDLGDYMGSSFFDDFHFPKLITVLFTNVFLSKFSNIKESAPKLVYLEVEQLVIVKDNILEIKTIDFSLNVTREFEIEEKFYKKLKKNKNVKLNEDLVCIC